VNMTVERWRLVEEIFQTVLDLPPENRSTYVAQACAGDEELRREVESLLGHQSCNSALNTENVLKSAVRNATAELPYAPDKLIGSNLGPYRLLRQLSQGGMGVVYLAVRSDSHYFQTVAIKLVRSGMHSEEVWNRFRYERQILANLTHPNIAAILDGGSTDCGSPYLVMEFIEGQTITDYCNHHNLSIRERIELFRTVCLAVHYAHQKLVIHRDIKPNNILVTKDGIPKLLDFGIAKLLVPELVPGHALETRADQRVMTPDYASPEQILGEPLSTGSDIYSLGVVLFELVTESRPYTTAGLPSREVERLVSRETTTKPSQVPGLPARAAKEVRGDLETIILMAMKKDPGRRYKSAQQLAEDLSRFLEGKPIIARADTVAYRTGKFVGRHKLAVTAAILFVLAIAAFVAQMAILTHRANQERLEAKREANFLVEMFRAATPAEARGKTITARELLDSGTVRIDKELNAQPAVRAFLLQGIAQAYQALGLYDHAEELANRSYQLKLKTLGKDNPATADALALLANVIRLKGNYREAEPLFRKALSIREKRLKPSDLAIAESLSSLGECLFLEGKDKEAEADLRHALVIDGRAGPNAGNEARDYLARVLESEGSDVEAAQLFQQAISSDARVNGMDSPSYAIHLHNFAGALLRLGNLYDAEEKLRESIRIERKVLGKDHPDLGYPLNLLGVALLDQGNGEAAEPFVSESMAIWSKLGPNHPLVATSYRNWARILQARGEYTQSREFFEKALALNNKLFDRAREALILSDYSLLAFDEKDYAQAEQLAERSVDLLRGTDTPDLATALVEVAQARMFEGKAQAAEPLLREALQIDTKKLPPRSPAIITAETRLGEALLCQRKPKLAEPLLRDALASAYHPPFRIPEWLTGEAESALAWCVTQLHERSEAEELQRKAESKLVSDPRPIYRQQASVRFSHLPQSRLASSDLRTGPVRTASKEDNGAGNLASLQSVQ
jgi:eukaryotic-like serine/threonine-protein kinase